MLAEPPWQVAAVTAAGLLGVQRQAEGLLRNGCEKEATGALQVSLALYHVLWMVWPDARFRAAV